MSKPENVGFRARRGLGLAPWKSPYSGIPYQELWGKMQFKRSETNSSTLKGTVSAASSNRKSYRELESTMLGDDCFALSLQVLHLTSLNYAPYPVLSLQRLKPCIDFNPDILSSRLGYVAFDEIGAMVEFVTGSLPTS